jgi:S-DNA-T family DNA segregation ATPase FtsK/SpoIIIE
VEGLTVGTVLFRRPARAPVPPLPRGELTLESPPELAEALPRGASQYLMLLPMVAGGAAMAIMYSNRGGGVLTYVVGALFGVSMLGMFVTSFGASQGSKRAEVDARRRDYLRYLAQSRRQVHKAAAQQHEALQWRHPPPETLWSVPSSGRMWERRAADADFGEIRVAVGAQRLALALVAPQTRPVEDLEPLTSIALRQFVRAHSAVPDLPLAIQLRAFSRILLRGQREALVGLARAMVCQFATFHSPDDATVAVVAAPDRIAEWDWVKWLPHAQDERHTDAVGPVRLVYTSMDGLETALGEAVSGRPRHSPDARPLPGAPHLLVVLDAGDVPVSANLQGNGLMGTTVIDIAGSVPGDAGRWLLTLDVTADEVTADRGERVTRLGRPDRLTIEQASGIARRLAPYRLSYHAGTEEATARVMMLPDLLGVGDAAAVDPAVTWRPRSPRERLRIPLGVSPDGTTVELDLKESALDGMGPHGLIIGATGSGKSELLRTIVTSLAVTHASDDLNFVLVDFKGGATFASMDVLPHVSAVITNLAEELSMVDRMQDAISGELVRRQELLRAAGNYVSRHEYELARKAGEPLAPLPSLLIICDEFSELLANKPDFIELFVMIGRLGRSLGVHLLLASQQLEEGRLRGLDNHLSYRIGLRTFSAMESRIVLGVPDAYELPQAPGHGYLKVGTQVMQRFRAAYVSGPYQPSGQARRLLPGAAGRQILPYTVAYLPEQRAAEPEVEQASAAAADQTGRAITMLDVIIGQLRGHGTPAHQVWLPPLDQAPPLSLLLGRLVPGDNGLNAPTWRDRLRLVVPVGIEDRPFEQRRDPLVVQLEGAGGNVAITGGPRAGKSTLLRTLIAALALTHSPREVQFMCIDLGGGALRAIEGLPHVGGVALRRDVEAVRRTIAEISVLMEEREARFAAAGIASIDEYRDRRARGEFADDPFGDVFLVIDGYGVLREEHEDLDERVQAMAGRCLGFGVHLVVTANRWGEIRYNVREFFGNKLELRLGDPSDSEIDRRAAANVPHDAPGRGVSPLRMQFLAAVPRIDGREGDEGLPDATAELVTQARGAWPHDSAPRVRLLPRMLNADELWRAADPATPGIPIGINETHLAPVYLNPEADSHLMVFGDSECGKTNLLRLIARSIMDRRTPAQARILVVDYRRTMLGVVTGDHLLHYVPSAQVATDAANALRDALSQRLPGPDVTPEQLRTRAWWSGPDLFVLVDDYDLVAGSSGSSSPLVGLADLLPQARDIGFRLVVARRSGGASRSMYDPILGKLKELDVPGLVMSGNRDEGQLVGNVRPSPQPPGRGVLVRRSDGVNLVQTAWIDPGV